MDLNNLESKKLTLEDRIALHRRMAESYYDAYSEKTVEDGSTYDEWKFTIDALYWSPYFGDNEIELYKYPISVRASATMEAKVYTITLPDWAPLGFECWPSDKGFVMQTHFGGHKEDGTLVDFYAYGFIKTNEYGEITRWETHVSPEYNDFLDIVIGVHGPFKQGPEPYMEALSKKAERSR